VKLKLIQDLLMLTKWNEENSRLVLQSSEWAAWIFGELVTAHHQDTSEHIMIFDLGLRLASALYSQAMHIGGQVL
jgi:hypothetical protein